MDKYEIAVGALRRIRDANIAVAAPIAKEALRQIEEDEPNGLMTDEERAERRKAVDEAAKRGFRGKEDDEEAKPAARPPLMHDKKQERK
jgi:hypothetical protein